MATKRRRLKGYVDVVNPDDGRSHLFGPADKLPAWAQKAITNPNVWVDDDDTPAASDTETETGPATGREGEPPRNGAGSGTAEWRAYAESIGLEVPEDASRADIFELVDNAAADSD